MAESHGTSSAHCPDCELGTFARNHYFTGKLLVERDFTDEQRYHRDKLRLHNQALHGWGVVCGLKVVQHPNPECRDKYVIVEPGLALDCCGHEILVRDELNHDPLKGVLFNFAQHPKIKALRDGNDQAPHRLQICLRYKECGTEQIPVLYDECGCDDTKCAPNRILESFELALLLDAESVEEEPHSVTLDWKHTVTVANTTQLALSSATPRLFIATQPSPGGASTVHVMDTGTHALLLSQTLPAGFGLQALASSADGLQLFLGIENAGAQQVLVLDATQLSQPPSALNMGSATGKVVQISALPAGGLIAGFDSGDVAIWAQPGSTVQPSIIQGPASLVSLVVASKGSRAIGAQGVGDRLRTVNLSTNPPSVDADLVVTPAIPSMIAVGASTAGEILTMTDVSAPASPKLHVQRLNGTNPVLSTPLGGTPVALVVSPGANWIYVLEHDASGNSSVEPISVSRLLLGQPARGTPIAVGPNAHGLALSDSGRTLYVGFSSPTGGVAILDVSEEHCGDLFWESLEGCPSCDTANCVVLATVEGYNVGDKLEDQTDPPADLSADTQNRIARIDNRAGRRLLPSTQTLADVIQCLLEHGGGGGGSQGPPGLPGSDGAGIDGAVALPLAAGNPPTATLDPVTTTPRLLRLGIPAGPAGPSGSGGARLATGVVRIEFPTDQPRIQGPFPHGLGRVRVGIILATVEVERETPFAGPASLYDSVNKIPLGPNSGPISNRILLLRAITQEAPTTDDFWIEAMGVEVSPDTEVRVRWIAMSEPSNPDFR